MACHVVILKRAYLAAILRGDKTIESRITRTAQPPYRAVKPGDRLFLKVSAGPFMATAVAGEVVFHDGLTPSAVDALRDRYRPTVGGDDAYWQGKRDARYATFVTLAAVEPFDVGPSYPPSLRAWHVVDDRLSPLREVAITAGAIRNRYAGWPADGTREPIVLILPDGRTVETGVGRGRMLRWRGWKALYDAHATRPGDVLRYVRVSSNRFRVTFRRSGR
jgi:hypothetical protein